MLYTAVQFFMHNDIKKVDSEKFARNAAPYRSCSGCRCCDSRQATSCESPPDFLTPLYNFFECVVSSRENTTLEDSMCFDVRRGRKDPVPFVHNLNSAHYLCSRSRNSKHLAVFTSSSLGLKTSKLALVLAVT